MFFEKGDGSVYGDAVHPGGKCALVGEGVVAFPKLVDDFLEEVLLVFRGFHVHFGDFVEDAFVSVEEVEEVIFGSQGLFFR